MKDNGQLLWINQGGQHLMVTGQTRKDRILGGLEYSMPGRSAGARVVQSITNNSWWVLYDQTDSLDKELPDVGPFDTIEDAKAYAEATYTLERRVV